MKIDNNNVPLPGVESKKVNDSELQAAEAAGRAEQSSGKAAGAAAGAGAGLDQVQLSGLSRSLRMELSESPERLAYLDKLSEEVASGRYQVDAAGISHDLIEEALSAQREVVVQEKPVEGTGSE